MSNPESAAPRTESEKSKPKQELKLVVDASDAEDIHDIDPQDVETILDGDEKGVEIAYDLDENPEMVDSITATPPEIPDMTAEARMLPPDLTTDVSKDVTLVSPALPLSGKDVQRLPPDLPVDMTSEAKMQPPEIPDMTADAVPQIDEAQHAESMADLSALREMSRQAHPAENSTETQQRVAAERAKDDLTNPDAVNVDMSHVYKENGTPTEALHVETGEDTVALKGPELTGIGGEVAKAAVEMKALKSRIAELENGPGSVPHLEAVLRGQHGYEPEKVRGFFGRIADSLKKATNGEYAKARSQYESGLAELNAAKERAADLAMFIENPVTYAEKQASKANARLKQKRA